MAALVNKNSKIEGAMKLVSSQLAETLIEEANKLASDDVLAELRHIHSNTSVLKDQAKQMVLREDQEKQMALNTNKLSEVLAAVKDLQTNMQTTMQKGQKRETLQWAITNAALGPSFEFGQATDPKTYAQNIQYPSSTDKVRQILMAFMQNCGHYIDGFVAGNTTEKYICTRWAAEGGAHYVDTWTTAAFEEKITEHIFSLTGTKPLITTKDGKRVIWYE